MMLLTLLIPALIIFTITSFTTKNKTKLRTIKVPVDKRKF